METNATRRGFLAGSAVAGGLAAGWLSVGLLEYLCTGDETPWRAFTREEAAEFERLAEELIPADVHAPGAKEAKVARFLDWQLAPGRPYAGCLKAYREHLAKTRGLGAAEVEKTMPQFFRMLLEHVNQGYYSHPCQGGNAHFASYRLCGLSTTTGRNVPGKENHL